MKNIYFDKHNIQILNQNLLDLELNDGGGVDLIVTSPPYNLNIKYKDHKDNLDVKEYLKLFKKWGEKMYSLMNDSGRVCLNIPYDISVPIRYNLSKEVISIMEDVGFKYYTTIFWDKKQITSRTAWGSFCSPSAPCLNNPIEIVLVFYKNVWKKIVPGTPTIRKDEFISWTNSLWEITPEKKSKIGHPAPFPVELPYRLIQIFSFKEDIVLDPFLGSGTTLVSCVKTGRKGFGIEISEEYCKIAKKRVEQEIFKNNLMAFK